VADELLKTLSVPVPTKGLWDAIDPASAAFPPDASPDLLNFRVSRGKWETRLGMTVWDTADATTFPGSGTVHFLANFYPSVAVLSGARARLLARNGILYDLILGTDTAFGAVTGGTGLSTTPRNNVYNGVQVRDRFYLTDRAGALKFYNGAALATVTQGTAPTVAPTTRRRTFAVLKPSASTNVNETWTGSAGSAPDNVTLSDSSNFHAVIADPTDDAVPDFPGGGNILKLTVDSAGSKNDTVAFTGTTALPLASHDIAFFFQQEVKRWMVKFEIGRDTEASFGTPLDPLEANETYLGHYGVGNLDYLKYVRLKAGRVPNQNRVLYLSRLYLPGRLFGKYRYCFTFRNSVTGVETEPSPFSEFVDCATPFSDTPFKVDGTEVLEKSVELTTLGNTLSSTHNQVCWYRSGGIAAQTTDANGQVVMLRLARTGLINSSVATAASAGDLTLDVVANEGAENLVAGDYFVIEAGVAGKAEVVKVASVAQDFSVGKDRITLDAATPLQFAHSVSTSNKVTPAFLDNVANESIDVTTRLEIERDDPPTGIHWLSVAPDGRIWAARYEDGSGNDQPLVVAVSNRPNADRPNDQDVFPDGVDPLTRRSLLQGWRFPITPRLRGDEIQWAGFFNGIYTVMLRRAVYQVHATSQSDWSPSSVVEMISGIGCIAGETVQEADGWLYFCADGPRVVRWNGRELQDLSQRRVETTLKSAPAAYVGQWFARVHSNESNKFYRLFLTPSGATTNTYVLDYDLQAECWESCIYGSSAPWATAMVQDGPGDAREMAAAHPTSGEAYFLESGLTDAGSAITVRAQSAKFGFGGMVVRAEKARLHVAPTGADTLSLRVRMGGSEYRNTTDFAGTDGDPVQDWNETLADVDTSEAELYQRLNLWRLKGETMQVRISGTVSNRPAPRDFTIDWSAVRRARLTN
jgi:hypothetical protein